MNNSQRMQNTEDAAVSVLAAASKTPFWTAFKITLGIGIARLVMVVAFLASVSGLAIILATLVGK